MCVDSPPGQSLRSSGTFRSFFVAFSAAYESRVKLWRGTEDHGRKARRNARGQGIATETLQFRYCFTTTHRMVRPAALSQSEPGKPVEFRLAASFTSFKPD